MIHSEALRLVREDVANAVKKVTVVCMVWLCIWLCKLLAKYN